MRVRWQMPCRCRGWRRSRGRCVGRRTRPGSEYRAPARAHDSAGMLPGPAWAAGTNRLRSGRRLLPPTGGPQLAPLPLVGPRPVPDKIRNGERVPQALGTDRAPRAQLLGACRGTATIGDEHLDTFPATGAEGLPARADAAAGRPPKRRSRHRPRLRSRGGLRGHCEAGHVQTFDTPRRAFSKQERAPRYVGTTRHGHVPDHVLRLVPEILYREPLTVGTMNRRIHVHGG